MAAELCTTGQARQADRVERAAGASASSGMASSRPAESVLGMIRRRCVARGELDAPTSGATEMARDPGENPDHTGHPAGRGGCPPHRALPGNVRTRTRTPGNRETTVHRVRIPRAAQARTVRRGRACVAAGPPVRTGISIHLECAPGRPLHPRRPVPRVTSRRTARCRRNPRWSQPGQCGDAGPRESPGSGRRRQ